MSKRIAKTLPLVTFLEDRTVPSFGADTAFSGGGRATAHFGAGDDGVQAIAVQADGRIVEAGYAKVGGDYDFAVVRLNADGTRDTSFGTNGRVTVDVANLGAIRTDGGNDYAYGVAIDGNNRILVAGKSYIAGSSTKDYDFAVVRLISNGARDTSFNGNGVLTYDFGTGDDSAYAIAGLQNGQMIVAGSARIGSDDDFAVIRVNANGTRDTTFNGNTGKRTLDFGGGNDTPFSVFVRGNGKIVLGGSAKIGGDDDFAAAQLNSDGTSDTSFSSDGRTTYDFQLANDAAYSMGIFADGSIGLAGTARIGRDDDFAMVKLTANGNLDTNFGSNGKFLYDFGAGNDTAFAITGDTSNHILLAGTALVGGDDDFALLRLNINGTLDSTFGSNGRLTQDFELGNDAAFGVIVQADGKIIVAGKASIGGDDDFAAVRFVDYAIPANASNVDTDGDGLLDRWETNGIDVNNDGIIDLNLAALGANPNRPDLFIEIDSMTGRAPATSALDLVRNSFNIAPVSGHGTTGIGLHAIVDQTNLPIQDFTALTAGFPTDFAPYRASHVGTTAERASSNWANILAARNLAFRYCLFGNTYGGTTSSGIAQDIVAQNFLVTLGGWPTAGGTVNEQAGTFMHELGHAIGLRHGGNDDVNRKPNYNSIMNYRLGYTPNATQPTYPDYSRESTVYLDWNRLVYNFATGQGANAGLDATRPVVEETVNPSPVVPPVVVPPVVVPPVVVPPVTPQPRLVGFPQFAVGADAGGAPVARFFNADGSPRSDVPAFTASFRGGVRTAAGDFTGDGIADVVVGTGPGIVTSVRVLDGVTGVELFAVQPFEDAFTAGVFLSVGDITGDGRSDLCITPDEGGGARVRLYSGAGFTQILDDFFGIDDTNFRGGARSAIGDLDGDGKSELIVSAGFGGGPRITVWRGSSLAAGVHKGADIANFFAFETALRNGSYVAAGDVNGDGTSEIIFGAGPGGGPRVRIFSGLGILQSQGTFTNLDEISRFQQANFFGGDVNGRGGVRVAVKNLDGDFKADLMVGSGTAGGSRVTTYTGAAIAAARPDTTPAAGLDFDAFSGFGGGVFVG